MVIRTEDVGYFHKEEIIIAQDKLDQIDITDNGQLIQFISEFLEALEDRIYTTKIHIEFENYDAMMDAMVYHQSKIDEYRKYINKIFPDCTINVAGDKILMQFHGNVSHSASIISELLKIDAKKIDNSNMDSGEYIIHL